MKITIDTQKEIEITKEDFEAYEDVRVSGATNMFNVKAVEMLSGLDREKIIAIMKNYEKITGEMK